MKRFYLEKKAYHSLENNFHINISKSGQIVAKHDSRIRYCIWLDKEMQRWVYSTYSRIRDDCREFILNPGYSICAVYPLFDQVCKFNRKPDNVNHPIKIDQLNYESNSAPKIRNDFVAQILYDALCKYYEKNPKSNDGLKD